MPRGRVGGGKGRWITSRDCGDEFGVFWGESTGRRVPGDGGLGGRGEGRVL